MARGYGGRISCQKDHTNGLVIWPDKTPVSDVSCHYVHLSLHIETEKYQTGETAVVERICVSRKSSRYARPLPHISSEVQAAFESIFGSVDLWIVAIVGENGLRQDIIKRSNMRLVCGFDCFFDALNFSPKSVGQKQLLACR